GTAAATQDRLRHGGDGCLAVAGLAGDEHHDRLLLRDAGELVGNDPVAEDPAALRLVQQVAVVVTGRPGPPHVGHVRPSTSLSPASSSPATASKSSSSSRSPASSVSSSSSSRSSTLRSVSASR